MPVDRFLHPKLGHSQKISQLKDFEFRVWSQYLLSADDFGVMPLVATRLKADNYALEDRSNASLVKALEHLIAVGLLRSFEHQGRRYVYQADWQDWQKVAWPTKTMNPAPPADELETCSERTRLLFSVHPGGTGARVPRHLDDAPAPDDVSRASEREIEGHLVRALPSWLGPDVKINTQVRLGNSYADVVATTPDSLVVVLEVKRHHITKATIAQVRRYAAALAADGSSVAPAAVGYSHYERNLEHGGVCLITYDDNLTFTVVQTSEALRHLPASFSLNDKPSVITGLRLTAKANGEGLTANGVPTVSLDGDFQRFQDAYPASRRKGGYLASSAYFEAVNAGRITVDDMLAALENHKRSAEWQTSKFIPGMDVWLREERWRQELPSAEDADRAAADAKLPAWARSK